jgi:hypothetical protein
MYSRKWTKSEGKIVDACIDKIIEDHPNAPGTSPFHHFKAVLSLPKPLDSRERFPQAGLSIEEKGKTEDGKTEDSKLEESKAETTDESKESNIHRSNVSDHHLDVLDDEDEEEDDLSNNKENEKDKQDGLKLQHTMREKKHRNTKGNGRIDISKGWKSPLIVKLGGKKVSEAVKKEVMKRRVQPATRRSSRKSAGS